MSATALSLDLPVRESRSVNIVALPARAGGSVAKFLRSWWVYHTTLAKLEAYSERNLIDMGATRASRSLRAAPRASEVSASKESHAMTDIAFHNPPADAIPTVFDASLAALRNAFAAYRRTFETYRRQRAVYVQTLRELRSYRPWELADLPIHPADFEAVARKQAGW